MVADAFKILRRHQQIRRRLAVIRILADGLDQLVCKLVALDVNDILIREILFELVTDGVEQVRFAEAGVAVDKEGFLIYSFIFPL